MIPLCDLQIVTGISMIVAGFVTLTESTYYHQQIISELWWLTINSFWVARVEVERSYAQKNHRNRKLYTLTLDSEQWTLVRKLAVFCSITLGIIYQFILTLQQWWNWDPEIGGRCFIFHDKTNFAGSWFWIAGTCLYALTLFLTILWCTQSYVERLFRRAEQMQEDLWDSCKSDWGEFSFNPAQPLAISRRLWRAAVSTMKGVLFWIFMHSLMIWSYGSGSYPVVLAAELTFAGWSTGDLKDLKSSNAHLVDGEEESIWGFGQVLPMVLLSLIGFQALDAWKESSQIERHHDQLPLVENAQETPGAPQIEEMNVRVSAIQLPSSINTSDHISDPFLHDPRDSESNVGSSAERRGLKAWN